MVCEWGMSEALGPLTFGKKEEQIFLGREIAQHADYSEDTALKIDAEVKRIVTENYERATHLLRSHKAELLAIADGLLAREVLDADQVQRLAKGLPLDEGEETRGVAADRPAAPPVVAADELPRPSIVPPLQQPLGQE